MIVGDIEDVWRFPGCIVFTLEGGIPNPFGLYGSVEKSSISSLNIIPVEGDIISKI